MRPIAERPWGPWLLALLVIAAVVAVDQLSKHAVRHSIVPGEERRLLPGVQLVNTRNRGVAFGFLPGSHAGVSILIGVALLALLVYFALHATSIPVGWPPFNLADASITLGILMLFLLIDSSRRTET